MHRNTLTVVVLINSSIITGTTGVIPGEINSFFFEKGKQPEEVNLFLLQIEHHDHYERGFVRLVFCCEIK